MKKCFKCGIEKPLDAFYVHPQMGDGHLGKCKDCTKKDTAIRTEKMKLNPEWVDEERARGREKYHRLGYIIHGRVAKILFPEKAKAHSMSQHLPQPKGFENHHWSYNEEHYKDTILMTISNHRKSHRYLIYDQERMMYRSVKDLILLDSKLSHLEYLDSISQQPF